MPAVGAHDLPARADAVLHRELAGHPGEPTGAARHRMVAARVARRARGQLEGERDRAALLCPVLDAVAVAVEEAVEPLGARALQRLLQQMAVDERRAGGQIEDGLVPLPVETCLAGIR